MKKKTVENTEKMVMKSSFSFLTIFLSLELAQRLSPPSLENYFHSVGETMQISIDAEFATDNSGALHPTVFRFS